LLYQWSYSCCCTTTVEILPSAKCEEHISWALAFICKRTKQFSDHFAQLWDLNHSWACSEENVFCVFIAFLWGTWYRVTGTGQALGRLSISSTVYEKLACVLIQRSVQFWILLVCINCFHTLFQWWHEVTLRPKEVLYYIILLFCHRSCVCRRWKRSTLVPGFCLSCITMVHDPSQFITCVCTPCGS